MCVGGVAQKERKELSLCLEDGRLIRSLNVGKRGPPIDILRTRLALLESYSALSQEVRLESQVMH